MKISPVSAFNIPLKQNADSKSKTLNNASFKGIYVDYTTDIGNAKAGVYPARFLAKDALMLNEIARKYPNQDCFICRGYGGKPRLEYRERPMDVQVFESTSFKQYKTEVNPDDKDYPCIPLIIHPDSDLNFLIGVPSYISTNPSLPFTVQAGFELHKKLIEKKYQILEILGKNESVDFGGETVTEKAHKAIEDIEIALTRYLVESAYAALTDRASASQIYSSNYPKVQSRLEERRKIDLTTSVAKQPNDDNSEEKDICEIVMQRYPDVEENKKRIKELTNYMRTMGISLENSMDLA